MCLPKEKKERKKKGKRKKRKKERKKHRKKLQHQIAPPKGRSILTDVQNMAECFIICHFVIVTVTKRIVRMENRKR